MVRAIPDILAQIVETKRRELVGLTRDRSAIEQAAAASTAGRRPFRSALESRAVSVIAEIKRASPSKGVLSGDFRPAAIAVEYEQGGAAALSVLTDTAYFMGSLDHLKAARGATMLPVLRKDFTIDEFQVAEAAANGADAILLIAALLTGKQLRRYREAAEAYAIDALVEVHDEAELDAALDSGAAIVGVNSRNLRTFEVNLDVAVRLGEKIPDGVVKVAESGIRSAADIERLRTVNYRGFLVGEHLMRAGDPRQALRELIR